MVLIIAIPVVLFIIVMSILFPGSLTIGSFTETKFSFYAKIFLAVIGLVYMIVKIITYKGY